ncbi:hypothetical protein DPMN_159693, partial [Dreissena polymorpha]
NDPRPEADDKRSSILKVEKEVRSLKAVNSSGVDNVTSELIMHGDEERIQQ